MTGKNKKQSSTMWRRLGTTTVAALLLMSATSCGGGKPVTSTPVSQEEKDPRFTDLQGRTVKIFLYGYNEENDKLTEEGKNRQARFQAIEKNFNCTLQKISGPSETTTEAVWRTVLAGTPSVDIIDSTAPHLISYPLRTGCYMDLSPFKVFNLQDKKWDADINAMARYGTRQFGVAKAAEGADKLLNNQVMYFNKRLVRNAGYNPDDLYKWQADGSWTWSKFEEVAGKIAKLSTKGSEIWGVIDYEHLLYDNLVFSNNTNWVEKTDTGMKFTAGNDKALEALQFYKGLYEKKIMPMPAYNTALTQMFYDGKAGFMSNYLERLRGKETIGKMTDDYGLIMVPKGPQATDYRSFNNWYNFWAIPTGCKDAEAIANVIDYMCDPSYATKEDADKVMNAARESYVRDEASLQVFQLLETRSSLNCEIMSEPVRGAWYGNLDGILKGEKAPAEMIQQVQNSYDATFEKVWKIKE